MKSEDDEGSEESRHAVAADDREVLLTAVGTLPLDRLDVLATLFARSLEVDDR